MKDIRQRRGFVSELVSKGVGFYLTYLLTLLAVALVYAASAKLGLSLAYEHTNVSPVWPPTGLAIAAVLLLGRRIWPAILIGALIANLATPVPLGSTFGIAIGNSLEALTAALILESVDFHFSLDRASDVLKFVMVVAFCATISATIGNLSLGFGHAERWQEFDSLWLTWWLGDTVGALMVTPLLLTWSTKPAFRFSRWRFLEAAALLILISISAIVTFVVPTPIPLKYYPIARLLVPFLIWAAFRLGQKGVTISSVVVSVLAIWGTSKGLGPFVGRSVNDSLLVLQVFLGSNIVMFLFLAATVEERKQATDTLAKSEGRLAGNLAVTRILAESPALSDATVRVLRTVCETFDWDVGAVWIADENTRVLRCLNVSHSPSFKGGQFIAETQGRTFEKGVGLPGQVWATLEPGWISDLSSSDNFPRAPIALAAGLNSGFAFPMMFGEKFLGVMEFFSRELREPDATLLATFGGIGNQIGQFVERKRAEDERERLLRHEHAARAEAERANRTKDEFLAIVSHELRTPLNAIVGWAGMLRSGTLDETTAGRAVEVIDRNAKAQAQLIEDLLDVSRIVSGNLRIDPRPVHVQQVIEAAIDSISPAVEAKRIKLESFVDPNAGPVSGDPDRLQQIVWNLLSNAVKFTPSEGVIDVRMTSSNHHVEIVVSDTGEGIPAEFLPQIFDRFRQADGSKTRRHGGLGLGLAIVRNLVELHGGDVLVRSDGAGKGASFTITLPCAGVSSEMLLRKNSESPSTPPNEASGELIRLRVLAVDDDPDSRRMLEALLKSQGADVVSVGSVREALDVLKGNDWKPTILLSDLGMPDEDGYDLIRELRGRANNDLNGITAIAITGYAGNDERERALNAGYQAHLTKPLDWGDLMKAIRGLARPSGEH